MKNNLAAILLILIFGAATLAQRGFSETVTVDLSAQAAVSFEPQATGNTANFTTSSLKNWNQQIIAGGATRLTRLLFDQANGVAFGYEITVETVDKQTFRVSFEPLAADFTAAPKMRSMAGSRRRLFRTLPGKIAAQIVREGEILSLDLLSNPQIGITITDKIRVAENRDKLAPAVRGVPRDLTVNEIEIAIKNPKLRLNGEEFALSRADKMVSGALVWADLPPKGFFVFSLASQPGYNFRQIGTVEKDKIKFSLGGDDYELTSDAPFLPLGGVWNVWVLHEPIKKPWFVAPESIAENELPPLPTEPKINPTKQNENATGGEPIKPAPPPPIRAANVRVGASKQIESIFPQN